MHQTIRAQDGLITRKQAAAAGMSRAAIERRLASGEWDRVRPEVFLSADHAWTDRTRVRAEMLWLGDGATLVGAAAAWWWRMLDEPPRVVRIAVGPERRVRGREHVVLERRRLEEGYRVSVDGVTVTSRPLTVVDAARELDEAAGAALMDQALLRRKVTLGGLRGAYRRSVGRHRSAKVGRLLTLAAGGARSEAERRTHDVLHAAGIRGWVADHRLVLPGFGPVALDIAFPDRKLVIEVDGWAWHRELDAFRRDPRRQNALVLAGWTVLRVTWHDVTTAVAEVESTVLRALAA